VVIQMLDMLWKNQTGSPRCAPAQPVEPITQEQAELAVNLALTLVQLFRGRRHSSALRNAPAHITPSYAALAFRAKTSVLLDRL
jgi:hypothetical protein